MPQRASIRVAGLSNQGRVRTHNEDTIGDDTELGVVVLADGMGGYSSGEIASRIAVDTVLGELRTQLPGIRPDELDQRLGYSPQTRAVRNAIVKANTAIYEAAQQDNRHRGMGTTLVMAVIRDSQLTIANVGDSRMYRLRDQTMEQLTVDHTLIQELVDHGFYNRDEARGALNKNLVTRALGIEPSVAVDVREGLALPGDLYLLCSDGLNDMIEDEAIRLILHEHGNDLDLAATALIGAALDAGGKDNVSVLLVRVMDPHFRGAPWYQRILDVLKRKVNGNG
ncbi:protein phosphatase [Thioalkalivibrio denitrificans]|uniref:Protein phosphatase n=1 Tax=Thioalkalivibrio denitrificans TaxID=108003 RepID=A0A1V3NUQ6_9GAMM|nr:Stp1/IreP family PP2C-type Ser/Thr phosphatase [Thioalkalivibrio denitrificans]OOG28704.1 protein phosphatase [Thioalkalivibrio denitrificans]